MNAGARMNARAESKAALTRRRILDAAARAFRRDGYASVTLNDIAALADLKAGSLYYHFDSKEEIVEEVLEIGVDGVAAAVREAVRALDGGAMPMAKLRAAIAAHAKFVLSESDYAVANIRILSQVPQEIRERHLKRFGALNWSVEWYDAGGRRRPAEIAAHLSTMILDGLTTRRK